MPKDIERKPPKKLSVSALLKQKLQEGPGTTSAPVTSLPPADEGLSSIGEAMAGIQTMDEDADAPIKLVPVDLIDPNPLAQRTIYTDEVLLEIATSLKENLQRDPIHVRPNPEVPGRFIIWDGWTRVLAIRKFGEEFDLPARVEARVHKNLNELEACVQGYFQNDERHPPTEYDRGMLFFKLKNERGLSSAEIVEKFKIKSKSDLTYYLAFGDLPDAVLPIAMANAATFGRSLAYYIAGACKNHGTEVGVQLMNLLYPADGSAGIGREQLLTLIEQLDTKAAHGSALTPDPAASTASSQAAVSPVNEGHGLTLAAPKTEVTRFSSRCVLTVKPSGATLALKKLREEDMDRLMQRITPILAEFFADEMASEAAKKTRERSGR